MSQITLTEIVSGLHGLADVDTSKHLQKYFKTGPGEYAEGDVFIGVRVPQIRTLVSRFWKAELQIIRSLLTSPIHEERLLALLILVRKFKHGDEGLRGTIFRMYLENTVHINNWDLIDSSAEHVVGAYLKDKNRGLLQELAVSESLWERRIAILSTFHYIKHHEFDDTLKIAEILLQDREDLIHKAVGWMLREVGNRNRWVEEQFLKSHYKEMPRTMLRYAIEKFTEELRQDYLKERV